MATDAGVPFWGLAAGDLFRFAVGGPVFEVRGSGWYGGVGSYDGGPWYADLAERQQRVYPVAPALVIRPRPVGA